MPLARNAATIPVRTSPVPAVASPGLPRSQTRTSFARRGDERVRPFRSTTAPTSSAPAWTALRRRAAIQRRVPPEQPRELARVRGEHGRRVAREHPVQVPGERPEAVGVEDDRLVEPVEEIADEPARSVCPPEARPDGDRGCLLRSLEDRVRGVHRHDAFLVRARPGHHLEEPLLEDGVQGSGHAGRQDSGPGAEGGLRGQARRARLPGRAADDEHGACRVLVVARPRGAAPRRGFARRRARAASRPGARPMSATSTSPGVETAGRDHEADLAPVERDRRAPP